MKKPSPLDRVIGNSVSVYGLLALAVFAAYRWSTQEQHGEQIPWLVPVLPVLASHASLKARGRIRDGGWSQAWDEMEGRGPEQAAPPRKLWRFARALLVALFWFCLGSWLCVHSDESADPAYPCAALVFLLSTAWGAGTALLRLSGRIRDRRPAAARRGQRERSHVVSVCLSVPWSSPREFTAAVPEYCKPLLARDASPPRVAARNAPPHGTDRNERHP